MYKGCKYLDYYVLMSLTHKNKSFLYRHLNKMEIRQVRYKNNILFNYEDVLRSPKMKSLISEDIIE